METDTVAFVVSPLNFDSSTGAGLVARKIFLAYFASIPFSPVGKTS